MDKNSASTRQFRGIIGMAAAAWNAVLAADMGDDKALYAETLKHSPRAKPVLDDLAHRRRIMSANDPRVIADFDVKVSIDDTFSVTAAAVLPNQLMDTKPDPS